MRGVCGSRADHRSGLEKKLDGVVVVWCEPEQQIERLGARGLSEEEAHRRIAAQLPVEEKLRQATETIDCSGLDGGDAASGGATCC